MANNLYVLRLYVSPTDTDFGFGRDGVVKHGIWLCDYFAKPVIV